MTTSELNQLKDLSMRVREHIIRLSTQGGCFTGASLSCVEILVFLYARMLKTGAPDFLDMHRDYVFLSKGHDVPALYGLFVELGIIDADRLTQHLNPKDSIYWHPNRLVQGVEFHSGSLGHLPAVASGVALDCKWKEQNNRIVVVLGDGELNEGSVWETALVASARKLDNLIWIIDRNKFQANMATEDLLPLEPLSMKFEAFGWQALELDGHDFEAWESTIPQIKSGKPTAIIAHTVRGKGLPSIEGRANRWFCNFSAEEVQELLSELHQPSGVTKLQSETLVVR